MKFVCVHKLFLINISHKNFDLKTESNHCREYHGIRKGSVQTDCEAKREIQECFRGNF